MKEKVRLSFGTELSRNQQKKVLGGTTGCRCANSPNMSCTTSPISSAYCFYVWPASGGVVESCQMSGGSGGSSGGGGTGYPR